MIHVFEPLVTNVQLSRRLKEAGAPQISNEFIPVSRFYWKTMRGRKRLVDTPHGGLVAHHQMYHEGVNTYAAYMVEELMGFLLPLHTVQLNVTRLCGEYRAFYDEGDSLGVIDAGWHDSLADACGSLYLEALKRCK